MSARASVGFGIDLASAGTSDGAGEASDAPEAHEAVVGQVEDVPRVGEVGQGRIDRVQHVARDDSERTASVRGLRASDADPQRPVSDRDAAGLRAQRDDRLVAVIAGRSSSRTPAIRQMTQTKPPRHADPGGTSPTGIVRTTAFVVGSIRDAVPSRRFATQTVRTRRDNRLRAVADVDCLHDEPVTRVDAHSSPRGGVRDPETPLDSRELRPAGRRRQSSLRRCL